MSTWRWVLAAAACGALLACGARTGLDDFGAPGGEGEGGGSGPGGAGGAGAGGSPLRDAGHDVHVDAPIADAMTFDASKVDCAEAGTTYIYVVTEQNELLAFIPPTGAFNLVGTLQCPVGFDPGTGGLSTPFSMAVDRKGSALVVFSDGSLFRVSTATASCKPTGFTPDQSGFHTFGMGFSTNQGGPAETLFVADPGVSTMLGNPGGPPALGSIDLKTFALHLVGFLPSSAISMELSGTGGGKLFGFYAPQQGSDARLAQIDKKTGGFLTDTPLPGVTLGTGWAFGFWGGDFYFFTAPSGSSQVTRYKPSDGSLGVVASYPGVIVGAGVSTCAPEE